MALRARLSTGLPLLFAISAYYTQIVGNFTLQKVNRSIGYNEFMMLMGRRNSIQSQISASCKYTASQLPIQPYKGLSIPGNAA
jgi:hypothetical protein